MKNTYLRCLAIVMVALHLSTLLNAQTVGTTFNSADGKMAYTVTAVGTTNTVSVGKLGNPVGRITIPDTVNYNSKTFLVTTIGSFKGCTRIDTLTIGKNITKIDDYAFNGCDSITEINYNATNCENISVFGDTPETYFSYAFLFNSNELCTINIGSNVQKIPAYIFLKNHSIKSVNFLGISSCKLIGNCAFADCSNVAFSQLILPDSLVTLNVASFNYCKGIKSLTIGKSVTQIKDHAFAGLDRLDTVYFNASNCEPLSYETFLKSSDSAFVAIIGKNVTKIPKNLFKSTRNMLRSVLFENGSTCTEIGDFAFYKATHLSEVTLPDNLKSIGGYAFAECTGLKTVSIPKSVTNIALLAFLKSIDTFEVDTENTTFSSFDGILYNKDMSVLLACPTTRKGLLAIPESVKIIETKAFSYCTELTSVTIPSAVTSIGSAAFEFCRGLHAVTLPNLIDSIGDMAFQGCENLTFFISQQSIPPKLGGSYVFNGKPSRAMLFVPKGSKGLYDGAFGAYFNPSNAIIEGMQFYSDAEIEYLITDTILKTALVFRLNPTYTDSTLIIPSTISYNSETYSVTAIGNEAFNGCTNLSSITLPNSVSNIGNYAFYGCSSLTNITLPESVMNIGARAFQNCTSLQSIDVGNSVRTIGNSAFKNCSHLVSFEFPDPLVSLGIGAFQQCTALTSCILGKSVKTIGDFAFHNCKALKSITIPDSTQTIGAFAFTNCTALDSCAFGKTVSTIGNNTFENCTALKSIVVPDAVTTLNKSAFKNCTALTSCTLNSSLKTISDSTFQACSALASILIPYSTKNVGDYAFSGCSNMDSLDLGTGIKSIGINAFEYCTKLSHVTIPDSVATIERDAFSNCSGLQTVCFNAIQCNLMGSTRYLQNPLFSDCPILTTIHLGEKVTFLPPYIFYETDSLKTVTGGRSLKRIGESSFGYCRKLASIALTDSLTDIERNAFYMCAGLTSIYLGRSIDSIGISAFSYCARLQDARIESINCKYMGSYSKPVFSNSGLRSVTIGEGVTSLPAVAFYKSSNLRIITMETATPPTLGSDIFSSIYSTAKLYVPSGSKGNYVKANLYTKFFSTAGTTDGARIIEQTPTAINKPADAGVSIIGTSDGQLIVQGSNELNGTASVYNLAGQRLMENRLMGTCTVLPEPLAPGMYVVVLQTNDSRKTVKIRVE